MLVYNLSHCSPDFLAPSGSATSEATRQEGRGGEAAPPLVIAHLGLPVPRGASSSLCQGHTDKI